MQKNNKTVCNNTNRPAAVKKREKVMKLAIVINISPVKITRPVSCISASFDVYIIHKKITFVNRFSVFFFDYNKIYLMFTNCTLCYCVILQKIRPAILQGVQEGFSYR